VHIQIPIDAVHQNASDVEYAGWPENADRRASADAVRMACDLLAGAAQPVVISGGGCVDSADALQSLIERLDAPVFHTFRAKGVIADAHPLCGGAYIGAQSVRDVVAAADVVLSVGTEFSVTDLFPHASLPINGKHIRIDIDPKHAPTATPPTVYLQADAGVALTALNTGLNALHLAPRTRRGAHLVAELKMHLTAGEPFAPWLQALRDGLPHDTIIVGDSTQLVYAANVSLPMSHPRSWLTSVTGYGTLGYALPAAIGAKLNAPGRTVVALVGDGGLQFTLPELIVAVEHKLSLPIVVWHNNGYAEIRDYMAGHGVAPEGVNISAPNLEAIAGAYGCEHRLINAPHKLGHALGTAMRVDTPTLIEVPVE
jgi:acetolactate synthase-1/2/3 large subunit